MSIWLTVVALFITFAALACWPWDHDLATPTEKYGRRILAFAFGLIALGFWLGAVGAYG